MKSSFALITTIILVLIFSLLSISIVETNLMSSNLNKLKYLHLQAVIHFDTIKEYIKSHNSMEISVYKNNWDDERFKVQIINDDTNSSIYYLSVETADDTHIRLSQKIIK